MEENRNHRDARANWPLSNSGLATFLESELVPGSEGFDEQGCRYRIIESLDRGGMGEVFLAETDQKRGLPRYAVVKRLLPELADDEAYMSMFKSEAEVMQQLDHPNIVRVLGLPVLHEVPSLALEFVEGASVQRLITKTQKLKTQVPLKIAAYIGICVANALDHAHHAKDQLGKPLEIVHRDVSPGNILISFNGEVKLTDFGIAKSRMSAVSTTVGIVKGKARYLAPEQILGKTAQPYSDVFSTAMVLVEVLTGQPLFERGSIPRTLYAIVHGERPSIVDILPSPAEPLADVLERALEVDPKLRTQTAKQFADELQRAQQMLGPAIDSGSVGYYIRGLFQDARGQHSQTILPIPTSDSDNAGSQPLNPEDFEQGHETEMAFNVGNLAVQAAGPASITDSIRLSLQSPSELGSSEPVGEPRTKEMDQALSMLAWLHTRSSYDVDESAITALPRMPWNARSLVLGFGLGFVVGILSCLSVLLVAVPDAFRTPFNRGTPIDLLSQTQAPVASANKGIDPKPSKGTESSESKTLALNGVSGGSGPAGVSSSFLGAHELPNPVVQDVGSGSSDLGIETSDIGTLDTLSVISDNKEAEAALLENSDNQKILKKSALQEDTLNEETTSKAEENLTKTNEVTVTAAKNAILGEAEAPKKPKSATQEAANTVVVDSDDPNINKTAKAKEQKKKNVVSPKAKIEAAKKKIEDAKKKIEAAKKVSEPATKPSAKTTTRKKTQKAQVVTQPALLTIHGARSYTRITIDGVLFKARKGRFKNIPVQPGKARTIIVYRSKKRKPYIFEKLDILPGDQLKIRGRKLDIFTVGQRKIRLRRVASFGKTKKSK